MHSTIEAEKQKKDAAEKAKKEEEDRLKKEAQNVNLASHKIFIREYLVMGRGQTVWC